MNPKRLKIRDAYKEDAGRGRIRIDSLIIKELNFKSGDAIEIYNPLNKETTAAILYPKKRNDKGTNTLRIDALLRRNIGASLDDIVEIRKIEANLADKITFTGLQESIILRRPHQLVRMLKNRVITKGDILHFNIMGRRIDIIVMDYTPKVDAVKIYSGTKITILEKSYKELYNTQEKEEATDKDIKATIKTQNNNMVSIKEKKTFNTKKMIRRGKKYQKKGDYISALDIFNRASEKEPKNIETLKSLVQVHKQLGNNEMMIESCERLIKLDPANSSAYYVLSIVHHEDKNLSEARKYIEMALKIEENNIEFLSRLLCICQDLKDQDYIIKLCQKILDDDKQSIISRAFKQYASKVLCEIYKEKEDIVKLTKLSKLFPNALWILGEYYYEKSDYQKAINFYLQFLEIEQETYYDINIKNNKLIVSANLGAAYIKLNQFKQAIIYLEKSINLSQQIEEVLKTKIRIYYIDKSLDSFNYKNILLKNRVFCYNQLGFAYHKLGNAKKAFNWINEALELDPSLEYAWKNLALLYFDGGNYNAALNACKKALEIHPDLEDVMELRDKILKELDLK